MIPPTLRAARSGYGRTRRSVGILVALALWTAPPSPAAAQEGQRPADPADVASVDALVAAVYDVISGPAGEAREWDRFRSLFAPGARLIPTGPRQAGGFGHRIITPDEYAENAGPSLEASGFFERELHRVEERYGPVVHVFSTYDSRRAEDAEPFARGINSFQLFFDGTRWWVMTIYWFGETPDHPIPPEYLPGG